MTRRPPILTLLAVVALATAACGSDAADDLAVGSGAPTAEAPAEPAPSTVPSQEEPVPVDSSFPIEQARQDARALLGTSDADLPEDVRIARRGQEQLALTMDLVPGRLNVELDDDGDGYRVVTVILETPDGSERFDLEPS